MTLKFDIETLRPGEEMYDIFKTGIKYYYRDIDGTLWEVETKTVSQAKRLIDCYALALSLNKFY